MTVVDTKTCRAPYLELNPDARINKRTICAGGTLADACTGDSGGPLMAVRNGGWTLVKDSKTFVSFVGYTFSRFFRSV